MSKAIETAFAKFAVAFVAVAMLLSLAVPAAQAQSTTEDLQAMINDLLAQVAALQGQVGQGGTSVASGVCPYTWTRSLNVGASGADVMKLQQFLNADAETRVSASGVGSVGMETEYYGALTGAAVAKFQTKYRSEILTPLGLVSATTYFGPSTMAQANALCTSAPVVDDSTDEDMTDEDEDMTDEDDSDNGPLNGGESSLEDFNGKDGDDTDLQEGQENAPVAEFEFDVEDGDIEINRVDVAFTGSGDETDPWDTFENVSLWVDGDMIAEMDVDDEDDWSDDDPQTGTHRLRFTGLDQIFREDDTANITVGVTVQGSVDGTDDGEDWEVFVPVDGIRGRDGAGIDQYTGDSSNSSPTESIDFSIDEEGTDDELIVKTSSNDPEATTLPVEDDQKSDWYTIFVFDLDTDDSINDIEINSIPVSFTVSSSTFDALVNDMEIVVDGTTVDDLADNNGLTAGNYTDGSTVVVDFDVDGDVTIDAGDRVEVEVRVRFNALALGDEGTTILAEVTSANADDIDAEGADDLDNSQTAGSADGEAHTLRTSGIDVSKDSTSAVATVVDGGSDYATYVIEVEVTAFEQDVYLSTNPATSTAYSLETSSGGSVPAGTTTVVLESTGDESAGYFEITEGQTETLTLTVTYTPGAQTSARLLLESLSFAPTANTPTQVQTTLPETSYRTSVVTIQD